MRQDVVPDATLQARTVKPPLTRREEIMWWGIGIGGGILYLIVAFTLGLMTLRNGHGWMFFFGIFFPILWIFGAFMTPPERAAPA
jgi:hypothetical protein